MGNVLNRNETSLENLGLPQVLTVGSGTAGAKRQLLTRSRWKAGSLVC